MAENSTPKIPLSAQYHEVFIELEEDTICIPNGKNQPRQKPKGKMTRTEVVIFNAIDSVIIADIIHGSSTPIAKITAAAISGYNPGILIETIFLLIKLPIPVLKIMVNNKTARA